MPGMSNKFVRKNYRRQLTGDNLRCFILRSAPESFLNKEPSRCKSKAGFNSPKTILSSVPNGSFLDTSESLEKSSMSHPSFCAHAQIRRKGESCSNYEGPLNHSR